jgi:hypothetical protein
LFFAKIYLDPLLIWLIILLRSLHKAVKPYFMHLHYTGRGANDDIDPEGFQSWSLTEEQVTACLEQLKAIPGKKKRHTTSPPKPDPIEDQKPNPMTGPDPIQAQKEIWTPTGYYHRSTEYLADLARQRSLSRASQPDLDRTTRIHLLENFDIAQEQFKDSGMMNDPDVQREAGRYRGKAYYDKQTASKLMELLKARRLHYANPAKLNDRRKSIVECLVEYDAAQVMAGADFGDMSEDSLMASPSLARQSKSRGSSSGDFSSLEPFPTFAPSSSRIPAKDRFNAGPGRITMNDGPSNYENAALGSVPFLAAPTYYNSQAYDFTASQPAQMYHNVNVSNSSQSSYAGPTLYNNQYFNQNAAFSSSSFPLGQEDSTMPKAKENVVSPVSISMSPPDSTMSESSLGFKFLPPQLNAPTVLQTEFSSLSTHNTLIPFQTISPLTRSSRPTAEMSFADPASTEKLRWKKRMNEIEAEAEARKNSLVRGGGIVRGDGRWEL